jgi:hypothetical protein
MDSNARTNRLGFHPRWRLCCSTWTSDPHVELFHGRKCFELLPFLFIAATQICTIQRGLDSPAKSSRILTGKYNITAALFSIPFHENSNFVWSDAYRLTFGVYPRVKGYTPPLGKIVLRQLQRAFSPLMAEETQRQALDFSLVYLTSN